MLSERTRDLLDGLPNPLLVRGMYQSLHSRKFISALWLLLGCSLVAYAVVFAAAGGEPCGGQMAAVFIFFIYVTGAVVLPFLAFSNLHEEVKSRTLELIHITRMNARKQVRGRMLASAVKIGLLFSVMGPFAVAAFLFKGEGAAVEVILSMLYVTLLLSVLACAGGVFAASLTSVRELRGIAKLGFGLLLVFSFFLPFGILDEPFFLSSTPSSSGWLAELLIVLGICTVMAALFVWFLCAAAANLLTFEADKCSSRTKGVALIIVAALWLCIFSAGLYFGDMDDEVMTFFAGASSLFISGCCAFWLTAKPRVAARHRKRFRRFGSVYKALMFPLADGAGSTAVYMGLAFCGILIGFIALLMTPGADTPDDEVLYALIPAPVYVLCFCALAHGVTRLAPRRWRTAKAVRGVFLALVALNLVIFVVWSIASKGRLDVASNPATGLFPFVYLASIEYSHEPWLVFSDLAIPALVGFTYHLFASVRHFTRYMYARNE
jgi:hypothetical protein